MIKKTIQQSFVTNGHLYKKQGDLVKVTGQNKKFNRHVATGDRESTPILKRYTVKVP